MFLSPEECQVILDSFKDHAKCTSEQLAIKSKLTEGSVSIEQRMFNLLNNNRLDIYCIPTIEKLGKLKGGYGLVREISGIGGLKKFRKSYGVYISKRFPNRSFHSLPDWQTWDEESLTA